MKDWELFEIDCTSFLNSTFGNYANFIRTGGSDSTQSDIKVKCNNGKEFFIEAKDSPSQAGQFVLLSDIQNRKFIYSPTNKTEIYQSTIDIMEYMNNNFEYFSQPGTNGCEIKIENGENIFSDWVASHYKEKNAIFIISKGNVMLHTEDIREFFSISATYRVKRSGSSKLAKKYQESVLNEITKKDIRILTTIRNKNGVFIRCLNDFKECRLYIDNKEFFVVKREEPDLYEIRQLSNTFHANVIFSLRLRKEKGISEAEFIRYLT